MYLVKRMGFLGCLFITSIYNTMRGQLSLSSSHFDLGLFLSYTAFSLLCRNKQECNNVHSYIVFIPVSIVFLNGSLHDQSCLLGFQSGHTKNSLLSYSEISLGVSFDRILSDKGFTKVLIRLRGSAPLWYSNAEDRFSCVKAQTIYSVVPLFNTSLQGSCQGETWEN